MIHFCQLGQNLSSINQSFCQKVAFIATRRVCGTCSIMSRHSLGVTLQQTTSDLVTVTAGRKKSQLDKSVAEEVDVTFGPMSHLQFYRVILSCNFIA